MKKGFFSVLFAVIALTSMLAAGCSVSEMSSLKDISRPYVGEYKCKRLQLGGEDELDRFKYVKLNLAYGGGFTLSYLDTNGNEGAYEGKYKIAEEDETVTLSVESGGKEMTYVFPYNKGKVIFNLLFHEKLLYAEFSMLS